MLLRLDSTIQLLDDVWYQTCGPENKIRDANASSVHCCSLLALRCFACTSIPVQAHEGNFSWMHHLRDLYCGSHDHPRLIYFPSMSPACEMHVRWKFAVGSKWKFIRGLPSPGLSDRLNHPILIALTGCRRAATGTLIRRPGTAHVNEWPLAISLLIQSSQKHHRRDYYPDESLRFTILQIDSGHQNFGFPDSAYQTTRL